VRCAQARFAVGFGGFSGGDLTRKVAADGGEHGLQAIGGDIVNVNIIAGHRADMSDPPPIWPAPTMPTLLIWLPMDSA
jgi:hypothetical protein